MKELEGLYHFLEQLPNGSVLPCRGRDVLKPKKADSFQVELSEWDYGCITVNEQRAFFIWSDKVESFPIRSVDIRKLVHFVVAPRHEDLQKSIHTEVSENVIVISHGYSPERG